MFFNPRVFKARDGTDSANWKFLLKSGDNFIGLGPAQGRGCIGGSRTKLGPAGLYLLHRVNEKPVSVADECTLIYADMKTDVCVYSYPHESKISME